MSVKTKLMDEFDSELGELGKIEVGCKEYQLAVDGVTKLADRIIEIDKLESDNAMKERVQMYEHELKEQQINDEKKDRFVKNLLTGVGTIGGLVVTIWGAKKAWKFEETGTVASPVGRSFINKLISFRK